MVDIYLPLLTPRLGVLPDAALYRFPAGRDVRDDFAVANTLRESQGERIGIMHCYGLEAFPRGRYGSVSPSTSRLWEEWSQ